MSELKETLKEIKLCLKMYKDVVSSGISQPFLCEKQEELEILRVLLSDQIQKLIISENIYPIVRCEWVKQKEDFIYHVAEDTQDMIMIIETYLQENN